MTLKRCCSVAVGVAVSCSTQSPDPLTIDVDRGESTATLALSHSPTAVAQGATTGVRLTPDLDVTPTADHWVELTDVTSLPEGAFAVLDGASGQVGIFASDGSRMGSFGRRGEGPAELSDPFAIATLADSEIVVAQARQTRSLSQWTRSGIFMRTISMPGVGDWHILRTRGPRYPWSDGPEDLTRRLWPFESSSAVVLIQPDEITDGRARTEHTAPVAIAVVDLSSGTIDTVGVPPGARLVPGRPLVPNQISAIEEPLFAPRPLVAGGNSWLAVTNGRAPRITVTDATGDTTVLIEWRSEVPHITNDDRLAAARWAGTYTIRFAPGAADVASKLSESEREEQYRALAARLPFTDTLPAVRALYAAGNCLLIAGFDLASHPSGTALRLLALNIKDLGTGSVIAVGRADSRIRHADPLAIYTSYYDSLSLEHLERYPLPQELSCAAR